MAGAEAAQGGRVWIPCTESEQPVLIWRTNGCREGESCCPSGAAPGAAAARSASCRAVLPDCGSSAVVAARIPAPSNSPAAHPNGFPNDKTGSVFTAIVVRCTDRGGTGASMSLRQCPCSGRNVGKGSNVCVCSSRREHICCMPRHRQRSACSSCTILPRMRAPDFFSSHRDPLLFALPCQRLDAAHLLRGGRWVTFHCGGRSVTCNRFWREPFPVPAAAWRQVHTRLSPEGPGACGSAAESGGRPSAACPEMSQNCHPD